MEKLQSYQRILALAQAGLMYGKDVFDQERYQELYELATMLLAEVGETDVATIQELVADPGYPTPKVDVRGFITEGDKVLLVQDTASGRWSLPGGYAEIGVSPSQNVQKEVLEETGLTVTVAGLLAIFDTNLRSDIPQLSQYYKLIFACEPISGRFVENSETTQSAYFSLDKLPPLSEKRTTAQQLHKLFQLQEKAFSQ